MPEQGNFWGNAHGPAPGTRIEHYEVQSKVGAGGYGEVYRATDTLLGRDVALKFVRPPEDVESDGIDPLWEARATARFSHPHIVSIFGVGRWQGVYFLVLEYLEGRPLHRLLEDGALDLRDCLGICRSVARALAEAHRHGIIHCDLKPENIFVPTDGRVRVLDFGLAALTTGRKAPAAGTLGYIAPEQFESSVDPTGAVDVWSLCTILLELVSGERRPSQWPRAPSESELRPLPPRLADLIIRGLQTEPTQRPSAFELSEALEQAIREFHRLEKPDRRHIFGRDQELSRLIAEAAPTTRAVQVIHVLGGPGVGKSSLREAFVDRARTLGLDVLVGEANGLRSHVSYLAWRPILQDKLLKFNDEGEALQRTLETLVPEGAHALLPLLRHVLGLQGDTARERAARDADLAEATRGYMITLVASLLESTDVVVFEDAHWMDSASSRLLSELPTRAPHVLWVVFARPEWNDRTVGPGVGGAPSVLTLEPLEDESMRRLLEHQLGAHGLDRSLASRVIASAAGNPLHAEELVQVLRRGYEFPEDPGALSRVLHYRMEQISPDARRLLGLAAAATTALRAEDLDGASGQDVSEPLRELLQAGLLMRNGEQIRFRHALTRDAAYQSLEADERRAVHRQLANWLLERYADHPTRIATELAEHWWEARQSAPALEWAETAAEQALASGAFTEAAKLFERCLDLAPPRPSASAPPERAMRWRRLLGEAWYGLGDFDRRGVESARALALAEQGPEIGHSTRAAQTLRDLTWLALHLWLPWRRAPRARAPVTERVALELCRAWGHVAGWFWFKNRGFEMVHAILRAYRQGESAGQSPELAYVSAELAAAFGFIGWHRWRARLQAIAQSTALAVSEPRSLAYAELFEGIYCVGRADWSTAGEAIERCQSRSRAVNDSTTLDNAQIVRFWIYFYQGEFGRARAAAEEMLQRTSRSNHTQQRSWAAHGLGVVQASMGEIEPAVDNLRLALDLVPARSNRIERIYVCGSLVTALLAKGRPEAADRYAEEALGQLDAMRQQTSHAMLEGLHGLALFLDRALSEGWTTHQPRRWREWSSTLNRAVRAYQRNFAIGAPLAKLCEARALHRRGRRSSADAHLRKGVQTAQQLGMRGEVERLEKARRTLLGER